MSIDRNKELREQAQKKLIQAQDNWLSAVEAHGHDFLNPKVVGARKVLDEARLAYLALMRRNR